MKLHEEFDVASLDVIFNRMIDTITNSKDDIFTIGEQSRKSYEEMSKELESIRSQLAVIIRESDILENKTKLAKNRLAEVSRQFDKYSEEQVKEAYENANNYQLKLMLTRADEKRLREKRDDLERRLKVLYDTMERANHIVNQVNVVLNYLTFDLKSVGQALENAKASKEFGTKIIASHEKERKRLSREIHDGPAQMMANVLMRTDLIERLYRDKGIDAAIQEISELKKTVRQALAEVRRIIYDLRPMALDDLGLAPTLKKYLSTTMEYNPNVEIIFQSIGNEIRLPSDYEVSIFRLVQESVNNAIKHGEPTEIKVKVEWLKNSVNVVVKDNGKGFEMNEKKAQSFGLIGMQERVDLLKGEISIQSKLGAGTVVIIKIPLNEL